MWKFDVNIYYNDGLDAHCDCTTKIYGEKPFSDYETCKNLPWDALSAQIKKSDGTEAFYQHPLLSSHSESEHFRWPAQAQIINIEVSMLRLQTGGS